MTRISLTPKPDETGQRIDLFLSGRLAELSRSRIQALIREGALSVGGEPVTNPKHPVTAGMAYDFDVPAPRPAEPEAEAIALDILYEDAHLIIINKPAGMTVHPAPGSPDGTLVNALLHHCNGQLPGIGGVERPGIVHRLDKDTTGVMVAAKTEVAHRGLSELFATHDIDRAYIAITRGAPRPLTGTVDAAIGRASADRKKMAVARNPEAPGVRHAITHYRTLEGYGMLDRASGLPAAALIECRLETGRTHQIRVHMSHIGVPVLGDRLYGRHSGLKAVGEGPAFEAGMAAARAFPRQALHAAILGFDHPVTGEPVRCEAPLHDDMAALKSALAAMPS